MPLAPLTGMIAERLPTRAAISTTYGSAMLESFKVRTDEVLVGALGLPFPA